MIDLKMSEIDKEQLGQEYMDKFKERMKKLADEVLGDIYCNLMPHIEHDSWTNYRNYLNEGFARGYIQDDFRQSYHTDLRRTILKENKDELVSLLNQDLVKRIEFLENELKRSYDRYF